MNTHAYLPFYKFILDKYSFLEGELSQEDVEHNKYLLIEDATDQFNEIGGVVSVSAEGVVSITTHLTEKECDEIFKALLNKHQLFATKNPLKH